MKIRSVLLAAGLAWLLVACGGAATGSVSGTWDGTIKLNGGAGTTFPVRFVFTETGGNLSGTFSDCNANFTTCQQSGTVTGQRSGNNLTFATAITGSGTFNTGGTLNGNSFSGLTDASFNGSLTATVTLTKK